MSDAIERAMPTPGTDLVPDDWCERVVVPWADGQYEQATVTAAAAQVDGLIAAYRTLGADTLELTKARRYLEVRWGELLGPPGRGGDNGNQHTGGKLQASNMPLDRFDKHRFRQMTAAKAQVVELMQTATDSEELSRNRILKQLKRESVNDIGAQPTRGVTVGCYSAIVIDPPWRYGNAATRGAAEDHYPTMGIDELVGLPELCPALRESKNSHLYLWTTTGMLREAFDLLEAWGYTYKTNLVWVKPQIGMGNYFRVSHEHVLFAIRGDAGRTQDRTLRSWFEAPREAHSRKPLSFYDLVEKASPGPYLDMFARDRRFGWDVWGNQGLQDGTVEVKNDQRCLKGALGKPATHRVYVETLCRYGGEYLPTGVARQDGAEFIAYVLGDELVLVARREVWYRAARAAWKDGYRKSCTRGSHPTKGVAVPLSVLLPYLAAAMEHE